MCAALPMRADPVVELTTNLVWTGEDNWFGGFSGIEIGKNGTELTLLTDRRNLIFGTMHRENGKLVDLTLDRRVMVRHANSKRVRNVFADSEGLAVSEDGKIFLSFETATRVARIFGETGITERLPDHPDFVRMKRNKGLEALAIHPDGTLYTLQEQTPRHRKTIPLYAFANHAWRIAHQIPRSGPFLSVGADFDAQGRFYLLERALSPLGFRSRVRRFDLNAADLDETTLLSTGPGRFDNLEALSVWTDDRGALHLTMISDDNFRSIQRTQIVEYIVRE